MVRCRIVQKVKRPVKVFFINPDTGRVAIRSRRGIIPWAHVIAQDMLGRELHKSERVHHKNHDCSDDSHANLVILSKQAHDRYHKEANQGDM